MHHDNLTIGILGTGNLGVALGRAWRQAGRDVVIAGRNADRAQQAAGLAGARTCTPTDLGTSSDVVVVAIAPDGLAPALTSVGGPAGRLAGLPLLDCTNAIDYSTGRHMLASGSAAERVAALAPGARTVKALHLFAGSSWPYVGPPSERPVVSLCGDDEVGLAAAHDLITALGGVGLRIGGLAESRRIEEVAAFVMRVASSGHNPRFAVPNVAHTAST